VLAPIAPAWRGCHGALEKTCTAAAWRELRVLLTAKGRRHQTLKFVAVDPADTCAHCVTDEHLSGFAAEEIFKRLLESSRRGYWSAGMPTSIFCRSGISN